MNLDDFKDTWNEMGNQAHIASDLNSQKINKMSIVKIQSRLNKILVPEIAGSIVCLGFVIFIAFNFTKLDSASLQISGVVAMLLFITLPLISLLSIQQLYRSVDIDKSYVDTLKDFAIRKIRFCKLQKLNYTLCYLLLVTVILVSTRIFGRNALTDSSYFFITAFGFGYIVLFSFSKWVFKKYNKTIRQTEDLLHELTS